MEVFKEIKGYEGYYEISNKGNVKSLRSGSMMTQSKSIKGYLRVGLTKEKIQKHISVHRLVAFAFINNEKPEINNQVNHKNGIKHDNDVSNLEWCNNSFNQLHSLNVLNRRKAKGEDVGGSILKEEQVKLIPTLLLSMTSLEISKEFNVSKTTITEITAGRSWGYLELNFPKKDKRKSTRQSKYKHVYKDKTEGKFRWSISKAIEGKRKYYSKGNFDTEIEAYEDFNKNRPL